MPHRFVLGKRLGKSFVMLRFLLAALRLLYCLPILLFDTSMVLYARFLVVILIRLGLLLHRSSACLAFTISA